MRRWTTTAGGILALLLLGGCPPGGESGPVRTCGRIGQQCVVPGKGGAVLGVCTLDETAHCDASPCLICAPQH